MAINQSNIAGDLRPISELGNYTIEQGDPDPRGWKVVGTDGHSIGKVVDLLVDTTVMKVRQLVIDVDGGGAGAAARGSKIALDIDEVDLRETRHEVFARRDAGAGFDLEGARAYAAATDTERDRATLTRAEEELRIGKRETSRGEARIVKHVETEHVSEPVTRRREELVVERRPVEAGARADATISDEEIRIPLMEEELIVEKRPVVKEELVVGKRVVEDREVVEADVRREEFEIDEDVDIHSRDGSPRRGSR